jgi:expansin (peptidoglycan-binding protein)
MAYKAVQKVVPITTPSGLMTQDAQGGIGQVGEYLRVSLPTGAATIYLGGADVTTASGAPLAADQSFATTAAPGEALYAVADTSSTTVSILYQGV